jgi:hypothetical protein
MNEIEFWTTFGTIEGALLLAPPFGAGLALLIRGRVTPIAGWVLVVLAAPAGVIGISLALRISFHSIRADACFLAIGYLCYCCATWLIMWARHLPPVFRAWPLLTLPILGGYLLGSIGIAPLVWATGDFIPHEEIRIGPSHYARITTYGIAPTGTGMQVTIFRSLAGSLLQRRLAGVDLPDMDTSDPDLPYPLPRDVGVRISPNNEREAIVTVRGKVVSTIGFE